MVNKRLFRSVAAWPPERIEGVLRVVDTIERLIALAMVLIVALVTILIVSGCSGNVTANWEATELPPISVLTFGQDQSPAPVVSVPMRLSVEPVQQEDLK